MNEILLEPLKAYTDVYRAEFQSNAQAYFDDLVSKSKVDVDANRATVKEYKKEIHAVEKLKSQRRAKKTLRAFLIFLAVLGILFAVLGVYCLVTGGTPLWAISVAVGAVTAAVCIAVTVKAVNPKLKAFEEEQNRRQKKADETREKAFSQMSPLNSLFESGVTRRLIMKTVPLLQLDEYFDMRRYDYLNGKYGFSENTDLSCSTLNVMSGEILGNPFVVERRLSEKMGQKTYTGSIIISWTTTYTDSQGHTRTQTHTQTLYASVDKPCPFYSKQTRLIYGNDAAEHLRFSHSPSHAEKLNEAELSRTVKKGAKKIRKKQTKAVTSENPSFTEMGNEEFDVLFGALDRTNEVEFRLLFTPLAQKNMLELMKSDASYGDDFYFNKYGCLNCISSEHSEKMDFDSSYTRYVSYDIDDSYDKFMSYNCRFFKQFYFDLAPLLAIPLYQQQKPKEYLYKTEYKRNYTCRETECAVNGMGENLFANAYAKTPSILKTQFLEKDGATDVVKVTAYAYATENRVDYVTVFGGDGRLHSVPVHWVEYIPVSEERTVRLKSLDMTDKQFECDSKTGRLADVLNRYGGFGKLHKKLMCYLSDGETSFASFDKDVDEVIKC